MQKFLERNWPSVFGLLGPLAYFSVYALWLPIILILLLKFSTIITTMRSEGLKNLKHCLLYFVLPIFGALSASWAIVPLDAVSTSMKFFVYIFMAILLGMIVRNANDNEKQKIFMSAAVGFLLAFPFALLDVLLVGAISSPFKDWHAPDVYNRGTAITACLLFPITVGLYRHNYRKFSIVFGLISLAIIFGLYMESAQLAVLVAVITFCFVKWQTKLFWVFVAVPLLVTLAFPLFFVSPFSKSVQCRIYEIKHSAIHRIMIYQFASSKIIQKPLFGWGMDASRSMPEGTRKLETVKCVNSAGSKFNLYLDGTNMPLHPHNAGIQIWLELGLVGSILLFGSVLLLIKRIKCRLVKAEEHAVLASTFTCCCLIYNISFGIWQSWLMFAMILIVSTILLLCSDQEKDPQNR